MKQYKLEELKNVIKPDDFAVNSTYAILNALSVITTVIGQSSPLIADQLRSAMDQYLGNVNQLLSTKKSAENLLSGNGPNGSVLRQHIELGLYLADSEIERQNWTQKLTSFELQFNFNPAPMHSDKHGMYRDMERLFQDVSEMCRVTDTRKKVLVELPPAPADKETTSPRMGVRLLVDEDFRCRLEYNHPLEEGWFDHSGLYVTDVFSRLKPEVDKLIEGHGLVNHVEVDKIEKIKRYLLNQPTTDTNKYSRQLSTNINHHHIVFRLVGNYENIDGLSHDIEVFYRPRTYYSDRISNPHPFRVNMLLTKALKDIDDEISKRETHADPAN